MADNIFDKVAIVTGGTGALGRYVVRKLADEGMKVYVPAKTLEEFNTVFDRSQSEEDFQLKRIFSFVCDATDENSVIEFVNNVSVQEKGNINYLINTVGGISASENVVDISSKTLDAMINLNLRSAFYFSRQCLKVMKERKFGRIVSIGAIAGLEPTPKRFAYSFTKSAVINLMDTISEEMKDFDIKCNSVIPSVIDTPANREWGSEDDIKKWVKPQEIAEIIYNLISDEFSSVRQSLIKVYGSY